MSLPYLLQICYWYHFLVLISLWQEIEEPPLETLELPDRGVQVTHWNRHQAPNVEYETSVCMPGQNPAALTGEHQEERSPPAYTKNFNMYEYYG